MTDQRSGHDHEHGPSLASQHGPQATAEPERPEVLTDGAAPEPGATADAETVGQPGKVMRIGTMIKQLLDEVKAAPLDDASRARMADIYQRSVDELAQSLSPDLEEELRGLAHPFGAGKVPSDAELRVAQAQLVGWLEGLFHGIQAALMAQQLAARQQLEQMRGGGRALPPGQMEPPPDDSSGRPGTYL
jgi:Protein of unknown function (DUF2587)